MSETVREEPIDGRVGEGAVGRDLDDVPLPGQSEHVSAALSSDAVLESAMATGEDEGTPGERAPVDPDDPVAAAAEDDAPLPEGQPGSAHGGPQDDGLTAEFREPPD